VEDSHGNGNEISGLIKYWEILDYLSAWCLLKNDSAPWSYLLKCYQLHGSGKAGKSLKNL
jgi:hypothetical protein